MRAGLLDHIRAANGLDRHPLPRVPHADAQAVALDELAALIGDVVRDLGRVQGAVNEPGERLDLGEGALGTPIPAAARDVMVILARVPRHLEGVVQEGRVEPRVVGRVLEDLEDAQGLLVGRDDRREGRNAR